MSRPESEELSLAHDSVLGQPCDPGIDLQYG